MKIYVFFVVAENVARQQEAEHERQQLLRTIEENRQHEEDLARRNKEKHMTYQRDLLGQIEHNHNLQRAQFERDEDEFMKGMQAEREYQSRLKACLDNPEYEKVHPVRRAMAQRNA